MRHFPVDGQTSSPTVAPPAPRHPSCWSRPASGPPPCPRAPGRSADARWRLLHHMHATCCWEAPQPGLLLPERPRTPGQKCALRQAPFLPSFTTLLSCAHFVHFLSRPFPWSDFIQKTFTQPMDAFHAYFIFKCPNKSLKSSVYQLKQGRHNQKKKYESKLTVVV